MSRNDSTTEVTLELALCMGMITVRSGWLVTDPVSGLNGDRHLLSRPLSAFVPVELDVCFALVHATFTPAEDALRVTLTHGLPTGAELEGWLDRRPDPALRACEPRHQIAVVVLTQATRPAELDRALASVRAQRDVDVELVLVMNGVPAPQPDPSDRLIVLAENAGIPAARNIGAAAADADLVMFLDDDAELLDPALLARVVDRFSENPGLGAMAIRLVDEQGHTQCRHVPRLGGRTAQRSGPVTHFVGAACVVRAETFGQIDGFDPRFFYAMEESDLSWRLLDAGWSIWYSADLIAFHPHTAPSRHPGHARLTARNRMWMAWRSLPTALLLGYLTSWTLLALLRGAPLREVIGGYHEAHSTLPPRTPMRWGTVLTMTRLGRPPVL